MAQLHAQDRGLHVVEQCSLPVIVVLPGLAILAVVPQPGRHPRDVQIVGRQGAAVAEPAQHLERIEAEASGYPETARRFPVEGREQRLSGVLDNSELVLCGYRHDPVHRADSAVQMYWQERFGPGCNRPLDQVRIHVVVRADIDEYGNRAAMDDRRDAGDESVSDADYLIARSHPRAHQSEQQRVISAIETDRVLDPDESGEAFLEVPELLPANQVALRQAVDDRAVDLRFQVPIVSAWIYERYLVRHPPPCFLRRSAA